MKRADMEELIRHCVRDEIQRIFYGVEPTITHRAPRGSGQRNVKKSVSVPREIWAEIEKLSGTASSHITNALRLYLNALKSRGFDVVGKNLEKRTLEGQHPSPMEAKHPPGTVEKD